MYRLTLVKEWNTEELESYAALVQKGNPDFIEVKVRLEIVCEVVQQLIPSLFVIYLLLLFIVCCLLFVVVVLGSYLLWGFQSLQHHNGQHPLA